MSTSRSLTELRAIVAFLLESKKATFEDACDQLSIPSDQREILRDYLAPELIRIKDPDIIEDRLTRKWTRCTAFDDGAAQANFESFINHQVNFRRWGPSVTANLRSTSNKLIQLFPDPNANDTFQFYGLVVGYVQSGKTANMAALIARAADRGYRFIIVLAGINNDLRAQTQDRLDQDISGYSDTIEKEKCCTPVIGKPQWMRYSRSGIDEDFRQQGVDWDGNPSTPKLLVMKKLPSIIDNFKEWISRSGHSLRDFPALIIDDESDQASINTKSDELNPDGTQRRSATNREILDLISKFPKVAYVGFTATPFANVLVDATDSDLYPKDFIAVLDEPDGYFGSRKLFGLGMGPSALSDEESEEAELPLIRHIEDDEAHAFDELTADSDTPDVLSRAVMSFVLSSCARLARGHSDHFSMLVHTSFERIDHTVLCQLIEREVELIKTAARFPSRSPFKSVIDSARSLWEKDFVQRTTQIIGDSSIPIHDFDKVWPFAVGFLNELQLIKVNSDSDDELQYRTGTKKRYIVVGGHRMSRGVTLEGLSVSVFLRRTRMYDTLLQMGRWFGYRPGYYDLTRIFIEPDMHEAFADLARIELELRENLKQYTREPNPPSPLEIAPRIRAHPTMMVTSRLKMGAGQQVNISYEGSVQQTVVLPLNNRAALVANLDLGKSWINTLGQPDHSDVANGWYAWKDIAPSDVLRFLDGFRYGDGDRTSQKKLLKDYVLEQNRHGELTCWDIVIPAGRKACPKFAWNSEIHSHTVSRGPSQRSINKGRRDIGTIFSGADKRRWLSELKRDENDPSRAALFLYVIDKSSRAKFDPNETLFPKNDGEHVFGYAIAFPNSRSNATVGYVTQDLGD